MTHKVEWIDGGREPRCEPNPNFPEGRDIRIGADTSCIVALPYPAKRCGVYIITCEACGVKTGVTTAGRPDDPRSVEIPCERGPRQ